MPGKPEQGWYVYGIVESDVEVVPGRTGVADAPVDIARDKRLCALVSTIELDRPLGTPEDLHAHKDLLDATAVDAPVLPFRFGAVLDSKEAVVEELLEPHEEEFANALRELDGGIGDPDLARHDIHVGLDDAVHVPALLRLLRHLTPPRSATGACSGGNCRRRP